MVEKNYIICCLSLRTYETTSIRTVCVVKGMWMLGRKWCGSSVQWCNKIMRVGSSDGHLRLFNTDERQTC